MRERGPRSFANEEALATKRAGSKGAHHDPHRQPNSRGMSVATARPPSLSTAPWNDGPRHSERPHQAGEVVVKQHSEEEAKDARGQTRLMGGDLVILCCGRCFARDRALITACARLPKDLDASTAFRAPLTGPTVFRTPRRIRQTRSGTHESLQSRAANPTAIGAFRAL